MFGNKIYKYKELLVILAAASFMIFFNLGNGYLWKDEAHTAQLGYNILNFGYPRVWDGLNIMTGSEGNDFNHSFAITSHGWLQFYTAAISIYVFGKTTFAARFPFALIGLVTIIILWFLAREVYNNKILANFTALSTVLYVPFLLYVRQARDYALIFCFLTLATMLLFYLIKNYTSSGQKLKHKKIEVVQSVLLGLTVAMLFYSNHLFGLIWITAAVIYILWFYPSLIFRLIVPIGAGTLLWIPWFIYAAVLPGIPSAYSISRNIPFRVLIIIWKVQVYFFPFITIILIIIAARLLSFALNKRESYRLNPSETFFIILAFVNIAAVSATEYFIINHYLLGVVISAPFFITSLARYFTKTSNGLTAVLVGLILTSNILGIWPYMMAEKDFNYDGSQTSSYMSDDNRLPTIRGLLASPATLGDADLEPLQSFISNARVHIYLYDYFKELFNDYDSPCEETIHILKKHSVPGETVLVQGIEAETIIFYTDLRVVNSLSEKMNPWSNLYKIYPNKKYAFLTYVPDKKIDWIVMRCGDRPLVLDDPDYLDKHKADFEIFESQTVDMPLSNSADLDYHKFRTAREGARFYILHRKKEY